MQREKIFCLLLLSLAYLMVSPLIVKCSTNTEDLDLVLNKAENDIKTAYLAVLQAENAGGNVSHIVSRLRAAAGLLAEAQNAYKAGDYEDAYQYALNCSELLDGLVEDAEKIEIKAKQLHNSNFYLAVIESSIGLAAVILCGAIGWRFLRRWYFKRLLRMKPEAGEANEL